MAYERISPGVYRDTESGKIVRPQGGIMSGRTTSPASKPTEPAAGTETKAADENKRPTPIGYMEGATEHEGAFHSYQEHRQPGNMTPAEARRRIEMRDWMKKQSVDSAYKKLGA